VCPPHLEELLESEKLPGQNSYHQGEVPP